MPPAAEDDKDGHAEAPRAAVLGRGDRVAPGAEEGEEEVTSATMTQSATDAPWIPIFSTGEHLSVRWTPDDLQALVRNHDLLRGKIIPPIGVGHDEPPILPGFNKS